MNFKIQNKIRFWTKIIIKWKTRARIWMVTLSKTRKTERNRIVLSICSIISIPISNDSTRNHKIYTNSYCIKLLLLVKLPTYNVLKRFHRLRARKCSERKTFSKKTTHNIATWVQQSFVRAYLRGGCYVLRKCTLKLMRTTYGGD